MNLNIKLKNVVRFLPVLLATTIISCQPEDLGEGNGLTATDLEAGFTIAEVASATNTYLLTANNSYISSSWNTTGLEGDENFVEGGITNEVFYPDAGSYIVKHKVTGIGGASAIVTETIDVETSDPVAGNIVKGGKFTDSSDYTEWTVLNISAGGATWSFKEGNTTIVASGWNQQAIYQPIDVVADKTYTLDMLVSGDSNEETWFEVMVSTVEPSQGQNYTSNVIMGLSTWEGCGTGSFNGLLSSLGCVNNANTESINNTVSFDTTGTVYLVIKCGGNQTSGISITNIEMRGSE